MQGKEFLKNILKTMLWVHNGVFNLLAFKDSHVMITFLVFVSDNNGMEGTKTNIY